ncbi:MAG: hypothetical protein PHS73_04330 [Candidatus Peribacteraceae bacterium]|nr:hypothetical protein [Candidatus Peribacteraceae bacterium]
MTPARPFNTHLEAIDLVVEQVEQRKRPVDSVLQASETVANLQRCFSLAAGNDPLGQVTPPAFAEIQQGVESGSMDDATAKQRLLGLLSEVRVQIAAMGKKE